MRVLQVGKYYYPFMGGIETHLEMLCRGLLGKAEVEAIVFNTEPRTVREDVSGVNVTRCAEVARWGSHSVSVAMIKELSGRSFDVLHLHAPNPLAAAAYFAARIQKPHRLIITHHSDIVRQTRLKHLVTPLMRVLMNRADAIIATSPAYLESSHELRRHRLKCEVIPYGVEVERMTPTFEANATARTIRESVEGLIILAVGRLVYYKGFDVLIRAMVEVDATLLLVGEGPLRGELERLARALGIARRVRFLGEVHNSQLQPFYLASDIFVLPSVARSEAFGIVQLEAMVCGLPVVNTQLESGVPFVSRHDETGLTVPPGDVEALAGALKHLIGSPRLRTRFGAAARTRVHDHFSADSMARHHLQLYEGRIGPQILDVPFA